MLISTLVVCQLDCRELAHLSDLDRWCSMKWWWTKKCCRCDWGGQKATADSGFWSGDAVETRRIKIDPVRAPNSNFAQTLIWPFLAESDMINKCS